MDTGAAADSDERILLVGGGDLGRRVADRLSRAARPPRIWALRRTPPAREATNIQAANIRWLAADVTRPDTLRQLPPDLTRVVVALSPGRREESAYRAVFIDGLRHVIGQLDRRTLRRLVFVSSTAVYGDHGGAWIDEATPPSPPGMNGAVLLQAEQWLAAQDLPSTILRLSGLYGPGRLQLLDRLRAGTAVVPRDIPHWANRMHADDAAGAIAHLLMLPAAQPLYIGSDDTPLPIDVLYDFLADRLGCARPAAGPAPAGIGSKKLRNDRLRADGYALAWPDSRAGYAALMMLRESQ
ncbi:NAD-dependent epimerase/dehydratase family protein [Bordetella genomosp. 11]|uniref:NAD(P)-dependent oxidoreductase n=1 Tax=Bordetella genomosp. 11 TaxID=1416808 RepID=A0A261UDL7_9BORD|nr:NAD-dependent epimerase/dehydratase family protein [Bordetella genomosp. 11]OZI59695.1 NAD(P)-dependent oxidoreductase [Bordetella genomosp. 11]